MRSRPRSMGCWGRGSSCTIESTAAFPAIALAKPTILWTAWRSLPNEPSHESSFRAHYCAAASNWSAPPVAGLLDQTRGGANRAENHSDQRDLADVDISLLSGRARLQDLTVGNPKGFHSSSAFRLHNATVRLDW